MLFSSGVAVGAPCRFKARTGMREGIKLSTVLDNAVARMPIKVDFHYIGCLSVVCGNMCFYSLGFLASNTP